MKTLTTLKRLTGAALALTMLATASFAPSVSAVQYDPNGTSTSKTPVFNHITGVPGSVGNEADFVRVRPKASTDNAAYVDNLTADCANNSAYTVRTYVHNGADPKYNTEENAIAVARNVVANMTAPLNTSNNKFEFKSTISSSNTASISDTGYLTCANGKTVKLTLVANSVQTYSKPLGFQTAPDASVNGSLPLGSRVQGDGNVFACWDDRIIVTYDVIVADVPTTPPPVTPPTTPPATVTPPKSETPAPQPVALPETGPAGVAAVALAVTALSVAGYYYVVVRRAARI